MDMGGMTIAINCKSTIMFEAFSTSTKEMSSSPDANITTGERYKAIRPAKINLPNRTITVSPVKASDITILSSVDINATTSGLPLDPITRNTLHTKSV